MGIWRPHIVSRYRFDGMHAFYVNALLRSLVFSMVGIFTPVFIYQATRPLVGSGAKAIVMVALFYLIVRVVVLLLNLPMAKVIEKLGFRRSVVLSVVLLSGYLASMIVAGGNVWYLVPAAILLGCNIPLYWVSRHCVLAIDSKKGEVGKQLGILVVLERVAGVAGPVAAGLMIEKWGFPTMYAAAGLVLIASVVPLFSMPHHVHRNGVSLKGYLMWIRNRRFMHHAVATLGRAMDDYGGGVVWPLAILLMGVHYGELGGVFSLTTLAALVVRYFSGVLFDKLYKKKGMEDETLFTLSAIGTSLAWIVRLFVGSVRGVLMVDVGSAIFGTTYRNVSDDYFVLGGKRMHEIAYYTYREMTYSLTVIGFCLFWIIGAWYGIWKELLFLSSALWVLLSVVQARESNLSGRKG